MKMLIILFISIFVLEACSTNSTGPEEKNGQIKATSITTRGSNEIFVTTLDGLYKSADNGQTWTPLNNFQSSLVSISPNGNIFFTSHSKTGTYTSRESLWRSTDGGNTFTVTGWVHEISANSLIEINFNHQGHIFAWKLFDGLFRSTNQGDSWDRLTYGIINAPPFIAPDDLFYTSFDAVYSSEDNGDNWLKVFELKDNTGDTTYSCVALAFNATNRIFCGVNVWHFLGDSVETGMIYYSDDNGNNWIKSSALNSNITHLAINSKDNIFAINDQNEIFICKDNGIHWNRVSTISTDESIRKIIINSNDDLFIMASNIQTNNIYLSQNDGSIWLEIWPYN
jgi:photosystem II stability/assembly factor-like uncharacterized protein